MATGFVIGGYTAPEGGRKHFGALLVDFYEGKRLKFPNRVATDFTEKLLTSLHSELEKIRTKSCPSHNVPAAGRSWDQWLSAAEMKRCNWVRPKMGWHVKFTEWTRDDRLRQPVFLGLREGQECERDCSGEGDLAVFLHSLDRHEANPDRYASDVGTQGVGLPIGHPSAG